MSERMTSERLAAAMDALENDQRQLDEDGVFVGVSRQAIHEVLAHLRSQTPPQAQAGRYVGTIGHVDHGKTTLTAALTRVLAEKPAPTPTPLTLTEEERALAKEAATITDDDAELTARALRLLGAHNTADEIKKLVTAHGRLGRALERLSAPTVTPLTPHEQFWVDTARKTNDAPMVLNLLSIIERLSASPTAPKGEA